MISRQCVTCRRLRSLVISGVVLVLSSKMHLLASVQWKGPDSYREDQWGLRSAELPAPGPAEALFVVLRNTHSLDSLTVNDHAERRHKRHS